MSYFASFKRRHAIVAGTVLAIALGTGHVMQSAVSAPRGLALLNAPVVGPSTPQFPGTPQAVSLGQPPRLSDRATEAVQIDPPLKIARSPFGYPCGATLSATPMPAAMIAVEVADPCRPSAPVTIRQGNFTIDTRTDRFGQASETIPVFADNPVIFARIERDTLSLSPKADGAQDFTHVGLIWRGQKRLHIHALEFGARHGQPGHIWSGAPGTPAEAIEGGRGYLSQIALSALEQAEIYTFPVGRTAARGVVRLEVTADVTKETCGTEVEAQAFQTGPMGTLNFTDILLEMPSCDKIGETVRLKNLLRDMRIAAR